MSIRAENLHFSYGKEQVLKNINFELKDPKIYGLLGRNGAGKTTLLSMIASFREPTSGKLLINGKEPFENAEIMQHVTFAYSKDFQSETDNAKSLIEAARTFRPSFDYEYAMTLVDKFKLDLKKPIHKLSKGKQSITNVIIGLANRSPITIFDEVYLGMDAPARDLFYKELLKEQELNPRIVILSTHLVSEMDYLFDDVIILKEGELLLHEEYNQLLSRGTTLIGSKETIDTFSSGKQIIGRDKLGDTHSVTIYGSLTDEEKQRAKSLGLQISNVSLHDLFIQLTKEENEYE